MGKIVGNILVTGGTGYIGSHTCLCLIEKGYRVIIFDSLVNSSDRVIKEILHSTGIKEKKVEQKIIFIKGDLRKKSTIDEVFEKFTKNNLRIDAVMHFGGLKSVSESTENPISYWDNNVIGTINLLNIMAKYECYKIVFSSSATVYGECFKNELILENHKIKPNNPYGQTKAVIENLLSDLANIKNSKWSIAILRYFNPIGSHHLGLMGENPKGKPTNLFPIINRVALGKIKELKIYGNDWDTIDGTGVRDYIHIMDLAEAHLSTLEYILEKKLSLITLNLGTGHGTSVLELINIFSKVNKVIIPYRFVKRRDGDIPFSVADNSLAKKTLNWIPKRNISEMCKDSWNWYKKNPRTSF